jgi:hypothetical protein
MAKTKIDNTRRAQEAEHKAVVLQRKLNTHKRAVNLGNDLWYDMIDVKVNMTLNKIAWSGDWSGVETSLEADLVSLQAELATYNKHDTTVAEALVDQMEATIAAHRLDVNDNIDEYNDERVLLAAAITAWLGSDARRGSVPR